MGELGLQTFASVNGLQNGLIEMFLCYFHGILPKKQKAARIFSGGSASHPRITDSAPRLCVPRFPEVCSEQKLSYRHIDCGISRSQSIDRRSCFRLGKS